MTRAAAARGRGAAHDDLGGTLSRSLQDYFWRSNVPLTILLFLLPMLILYEIGTYFYASDWVTHTETRVLAFNLVRQFLGLFGATWPYLPSFALVAILLAWQIIRRDRWELHVGTAMLMGVEACLLALPILALGRVLGYVLPLYTSAAAWKSGVVLALGAGVYEELVFRFGAFAMLDAMLVDLLKVNRRSAMVLVVFSTSILFASYHYWSPQSELFHWRDFIFRTACGAYFGILLLCRGFGVTAGAHAAYDVFFFGLRGLASA